MEIIDLERGRTQAQITPHIGGRLHQLSIREHDTWIPLLHEPASLQAAAADPIASSSYLMAPWPNRIEGGRFTFDGRLYQVPVNRDGHALHGRTLFQPWSVDRRTTSSCTLSVEIDGGWPFAGRVTQRISLRDDGIDQHIEVHAAGAPFPAGIGWHPWWRRDVRPGHEVAVRVDADDVYETVGMIPTGWLQRATGDRDLRRYPAIGRRLLDSCYRHPRGPLCVRWGDIELTMRSSPNMTHAVVYTGTPHSVVVEPQTCAIDAFNLEAQGLDGTGTIIVSPGRPLLAWTRWRWTIGR